MSHAPWRTVYRTYGEGGQRCAVDTLVHHDVRSDMGQAPTDTEKKIGMYIRGFRSGCIHDSP